MSLRISFEKRVFTVDFLQEYQQHDHKWTDYITLKRLMEECSKITQIPLENVKLMYSGGKWTPPHTLRQGEQSSDWLSTVFNVFSSKDDDLDNLKSGSFVLMKEPLATLSKYGIRNESKLFMLASQPQLLGDSAYKEEKKSGSSGRAESLRLQRLESINAEAREVIIPIVKKFQEDIEQIKQKHTSFTPKYIKDSHARASELLMQTLLKVDGVVCEPEFEHARTKRREMVKFFQGYLEEIDVLKEEVLIIIQTSNTQ